MKKDFFYFLKNNLLYIFLFSLFDSILIFSYFLINDFLKPYFSDIIYNLYLLLSQNSKDLFNEFITHRLKIADYPELQAIIYKFIKLHLIKYSILFVIFLILSYLMWFLIFKINKIKTLKYYWLNLGISLFVIFIFFILFENLDLIIKINLLLNGVKKILNNYTYGFWGLIVLSYFYLVLPVSLNTKSKLKNSFSIKLIIWFIILAIVMYGLNLMILGILKYSFIIALILTLLLLMPLIMLYRNYAVYSLFYEETTNKNKQKNKEDKEINQNREVRIKKKAKDKRIKRNKKSIKKAKKKKE